MTQDEMLEEIKTAYDKNDSEEFSQWFSILLTNRNCPERKNIGKMLYKILKEQANDES